eukprot:32435-Rhodomonas_salina.1
MLPPSCCAELCEKVELVRAREPLRAAMAPPSCAELHATQRECTAETTGSDGASTSLDSPARTAPPGPADAQPTKVHASRWRAPRVVMAPPPRALLQPWKELASTVAAAPRITNSAPPSPPAEHSRKEELRTRTGALVKRTPPW